MMVRCLDKTEDVEEEVEVVREEELPGNQPFY